jgi:hypothetical protein
LASFPWAVLIVYLCMVKETKRGKEKKKDGNKEGKKEKKIRIPTSLIRAARSEVVGRTCVHVGRGRNRIEVV